MRSGLVSSAVGPAGLRSNASGGAIFSSMKLQLLRPMHLRYAVITAAILGSVPVVVFAQEKQRFASLEEAMQAGGVLNGRGGPRNVVWIDGGTRYSYLAADPVSRGEVIRAVDPATGKDTLVFSAAG